MSARETTPAEDRAIRDLKALAKRWPKTLKLFAWSGALYVMDADMEPGSGAVINWISGIPNDGGDPS